MVPADYFYASADGLRLYCGLYSARRSGGLPVLCLPGLTRNGRDFVALAARLSELHDVVMAAMKPALIAAIVLNEAGPEVDPAGLRRIASYAGKLPRVSSWAEAASQAKSVYGSALPGLSDAQWLEYARQGYREIEGVPVPDLDPKIAAAFANPATGPSDLWPVYAQVKTTPMLVIRGALSDLSSAATVARMTREKPDLHHATVPNRGHAPLLNEPESLTAIDDFLARHGRDAPSAIGET